MTTAPSSKANCTVLYFAVALPPCFSVANLSSKLRLKNGNSEIGGNKMSLTKLDTTVLNAAARISPTATSSTLSRSAKSQKSFHALLNALRCLSEVGKSGVVSESVISARDLLFCLLEVSLETWRRTVEYMVWMMDGIVVMEFACVNR